MQFSHILVATYKNGRTGVASLCTVFLEDVSEGQPVDCEADEEYTVEVDEEAGRGQLDIEEDDQTDEQYCMAGSAAQGMGYDIFRTNKAFVEDDAVGIVTEQINKVQ